MPVSVSGAGNGVVLLDGDETGSGDVFDDVGNDTPATPLGSSPVGLVTGEVMPGAGHVGAGGGLGTAGAVTLALGGDGRVGSGPGLGVVRLPVLGALGSRGAATLVVGGATAGIEELPPIGDVTAVPVGLLPGLETDPPERMTETCSRVPGVVNPAFSPVRDTTETLPPIAALGAPEGPPRMAGTPAATTTARALAATPAALTSRGPLHGARLVARSTRAWEPRIHLRMLNRTMPAMPVPLSAAYSRLSASRARHNRDSIVETRTPSCSAMR